MKCGNVIVSLAFNIVDCIITIIVLLFLHLHLLVLLIFDKPKTGPRLKLFLGVPLLSGQLNCLVPKSGRLMEVKRYRIN